MGGNNSAHELVLLDQAGHALAEAHSVGEIKTIRDKAEAVRKYAQSASLGLDVQNRAAEVKLRAERQAGKLLGQLMLRGGDRRSKSHHDRLKLGDLGLTANQSKRWQLQARIPEDIFHAHIKSTCNQGKELTSAGLMRLAKRLNEEHADPNSHTKGTKGQSSNRHVPSRNVELPANRLQKWSDKHSTNARGDIVGELLNHHKILDGILRPLYAGESASLRPAELRILRYLMTETGALLGQLELLEADLASCMCHQDRAAV